jgi:hypothetical protein
MSLLLVAMFLTRRVKGPVWAFAVAWLVCMSPIAFGLIRYSYFTEFNASFEVQLFALFSAFLLGAALDSVRYPAHVWLGRMVSSAYDESELSRALPIAKFCWLASIIGAGCLALDFAFLEGVGLDDLAALRELYVATTKASALARIGTVLVWGGIYCFIFALLFRRCLTRLMVGVFMLPVAGYLLVALFSAGRQAAFQIAIVATFTMLFDKARHAGAVRRSRAGGVLLSVVIGASMVAYMGYIAVARNDLLLSSDKIVVLARLFDFELYPDFDLLLSALGESVRTTAVEAIVYFSSSVALFSKFLSIDWGATFYGAMSFPFAFRQIEPATGLSVLESLAFKIEMMRGAGVIGAGWTTAISSHILDWGFVGAAMFLFLQGFWSAVLWRRALLYGRFHDAVLALLLLVAAAYLPMVPAFSDTSLFLLLVFCILVRLRLAWAASSRTPHSGGHMLASPPMSFSR